MKIDIYRSTASKTKYLSIPAGTEPSKLKVPKDFDPDLKKIALFKSGTEIKSGDETIGLNSAEIIEQIKKNGYAVHRAAVVTKEKV